MRTFSAAAYLDEVTRLISLIDPADIEKFADILCKARESGSFVFACGNGGSGATASHFIEDLAKGICFPPGEARFRALALSDSVPLLTAYGNDMGYEHIFAEQLLNFVSPGDVLLVFSGSGNSTNILRALEKARQAGAISLAFGGTGGGKMKSLADHTIVVQSDNMQQIEDVHLILAHSLYSLVRDRCEGRIPTE